MLEHHEGQLGWRSQIARFDRKVGGSGNRANLKAWFSNASLFTDRLHRMIGTSQMPDPRAEQIERYRQLHREERSGYSRWLLLIKELRVTHEVSKPA